MTAEGYYLSFLPLFNNRSLEAEVLQIPALNKQPNLSGDRQV
jgi:hypothetical protein